MTLKQQNKRREERLFAGLPVDLGATKGTTRDVSASGLFFEVDASYALGSSVDLTVELHTQDGKMLIKCRGDIVRIEPCGKKVGVAVTITESKMEAVKQKRSG